MGDANPLQNLTFQSLKADRWRLLGHSHLPRAILFLAFRESSGKFGIQVVSDPTYRIAHYRYAWSCVSCPALIVPSPFKVEHRVS